MTDNLAKSYKHALDNGSIKVVCGDGRQGYKECAPYDVINVGAYSDQIPQAFVEQLKVGGILCMPATLSDGH